MRVCLLLLVLLVNCYAVSINFAVLSSAATPNTAKSLASQYSILLNATTPFQANFNINLTFPSAFSLVSVSACDFNCNGASVSSAVCSLNTATNTITFSNANLVQTVSSVVLNFTTATARFTAVQVVTLQYYDPITNQQYGTNSAPIVIIEAVMPCTVSTNSTLTGDSVSYTIGFTPSVTIETSSIVQIQLPPWSPPYNLSNFLTTNTGTICNNLCTIITPNSQLGYLTEIIKYSSLYPASNSNAMSLTLAAMRNPASTLPISVIVTVMAYVSASSQPSYMSCTATFTASSPNSFKAVSMTLSNTSISGSNSVKALLSLTNLISSQCSLLVTPASSDLSVSFRYTTSNQLTAQTVQSTLNGQLIGNLTNATSPFYTLFLGDFIIVNPPYATLPVGVTFKSQYLSSSKYYPIDQLTVLVSATVSTIVTAGVTCGNLSLATKTYCVVTFTLVNNLITGSIITVTLPAEMSSISLSCTLSLSSTYSSTAATSASATLNSPIAGGTSLTMTLTNVVMPLTTTQSSSFTISTFYYNLTTPVDILTAGVTVTATPVHLASAILSASSLTVASISTYTLTIQPTNTLPAGAYFTVRFPLDSFPVSTPTLTSFSIAGVIIASCQMSTLSTLNFNFTSCITTAVSSSSTMTIVLANLINPYSTKPTSSLALSTFYNRLLMEYLSTGVNIVMNTPATITSFTVVPNIVIANTLASYTFSIVFKVLHFNGDRIILNFPKLVTIGASFTCTSQTSGLTTSCLQTSDSVLVVTLSGSSESTYSSLTFVVSQITNHWYNNVVQFSLTTTTNDSSIATVQSGTASVTFIPSALQASAANNNLIVLLSQSTIMLTITNTNPPTSLQSYTQLQYQIVVPTQLTSNAGSCTTSQLSAVCTLSSSNTWTINSLTSISTPLSVTFTAVTAYFSNTSPFSISLQYGPNIVATNTNVVVNSYCTSPCMQCSTSPTQCLSCLPNSHTSNTTWLSYNNTCVQTCPDNFYLLANNTCASCNAASCLNCLGTATTCTSCSAPKLLLLSACVTDCGSTYFPSGRTCQSCVSPCRDCTSLTSCLSCATSYSLNADTSCTSICKLSTQIGINGICQTCTNNCLTCSIVLTNCTSCSNAFILYSNTCIRSCPATLFNNTNSLCQACISPCVNCLSEAVCLTCVANYYLYNSTSCIANCPPGTVAYVSECVSCTGHCATCTGTASTCVTCLATFYFYLSDCVASCTLPTVPYNGQCTACVPPCAACLSTAYTCSSCITNYRLLDATCVQTCPTIGYIQTNTNCVPCTNNCLSCSVISSNCTACDNTFILFSNTCIRQCAVGSFNNSNSLCQTCIFPCSTCNSATICLTCVTNYYLYNKNVCIDSCPAGTMAYVAECISCASKCATCKDTVSTCVTCISTLNFYLSDCVANCPSPTMAYNGVCVTCAPPCATCSTSAVTCSSCITSYQLLNTQCVKGCPDIGYIQTQTKCLSCTNNCLGCSVSTSNCTSCLSGFSFFSNTCVPSCPPSTFNDSQSICQPCVSPCRTCTSSTSCQTCVTNYYIYRTTQCVSPCPPGTIAYVSQCQGCASKCATCTNTISTCLKCVSGLYYYLGDCLSTCPQLTYPYNGQCTTCAPPCATCLTSAFSCSTCIVNRYLLGTTCVTTCPEQGYYQTTTKCMSCSSNCIKCHSAATCTVCDSNYYILSGVCSSSCPSSSPIVINQTCTGCNVQCATCDTSAGNCLTCTVGYFRYSYTCLTSCPITYYSDLTNYTCADGLASKIVFFPVLITLLIALALVGIVKWLSPTTSFFTVSTAMCSFLQIAIWCYLLSLLVKPINQPDILYSLPIALTIIPFLTLIIANITFFILNSRRVSHDDYATRWCNNNINHTFLKCARYLALAVSHKLFRLVYSKMFNSLHLSLVVYQRTNLFLLATLATIFALIFCEVPILVAGFYLAYIKLLKDQVFYTAIEALLVTATAMLLSLIDIHKPEDYFQDTEFMRAKRDIEKVKDSSMNRLEDGYYVQKDQGSVEGEKFVSRTGGKFTFSKHDPNSFNELLFEQTSGASMNTDAMESNKTLPIQSPRKAFSQANRINIFDPIKEEEAEYYEQEKYELEDIHTAVALQKHSRQMNSDESEEQMSEGRAERRRELGVPSYEQLNDAKSVLEYRPQRGKWNNLISHRQNLAKQIFNSIEPHILEKIQQPANEDEDEKQPAKDKSIAKEAVENIEDTEQSEFARRRFKKRRRKPRGNKELEQIYLQRLTQSKKNIFASSRSIRYDF